MLAVLWGLNSWFTTRHLGVMAVGKTGLGKSHLGNLMAGEDAFAESDGFSSATERCAQIDYELAGRAWTFTDAPGLLDTQRSHEQILEVLGECGLGQVDAFALVVPCGRFGPAENALLTLVESSLGRQALAHAVLVFAKCGQADDAAVATRLAQLAEDDPANALFGWLTKLGHRWVAVGGSEGMPAPAARRAADRAALHAQFARVRRGYDEQLFYAAVAQRESLAGLLQGESLLLRYFDAGGISLADMDQAAQRMRSLLGTADRVQRLQHATVVAACVILAGLVLRKRWAADATETTQGTAELEPATAQGTPQEAAIAAE